MKLFRTMQDDLNELVFQQFGSRLEQDRMLQALYDKGYSTKEIANKLSLNKNNVYARIEAHRGRGPMRA